MIDIEHEDVVNIKLYIGWLINHDNQDEKTMIPKQQEQQYAEWLAACRLAAKGKTLADSR